MTTAVLTPAAPTRSADAMLRAAVRLWFAVTVAGQALFLWFILGFYGSSTLSGNFEAWNRKPLIQGYTPGDTVGNLAFAGHVLLAAVVTFAGALQLVPQVRARAPVVHRWSGRLFLFGCLVGAVTGLYMTWFRAVDAPLLNEIAITIDAVLILAFGALALRTALGRDFAAHQRWALRLFMAANAVWFLRIGVSAYGLANAALGGPDLTLESPVFAVLNFGCYLIPLAVIELYFRARGGAAGARAAMAAGLVLASLVTAAGAFGSWVGMFAPALAKV